jgi:uncharacterized membrane protein YccC
MGFVPFVVVISGVMFLVISLNYHTFRNYRNRILELISLIQDKKAQVRAEVDQLESVSVPELENFCESMCGYLSGRLESNTLEEKLSQINRAFEELYSDLESKHIQEELLKSINLKVREIARLNRELRETQNAYEKLRAEKPYSWMGRWFHFESVPLPWENPKLV